MKRKLIIIVVLLLAVLFAVFGWWKHLHPVSQSALNEFNANSDFPYGLATPETLLGDTSDFEMYHGYGCYLLENEDISIWIGGYPDVLDDGHVTRYDVKTAKYSILGLRIGDDMELVDTTLRKFGYHWVSGNNSRNEGYMKGGIHIFFVSEDENGCMSEFSVSLRQTNRHHVLF